MTTDDRLLLLEAHIKQLQEQLCGHHLVMGWMLSELARTPWIGPDQVRHFLVDQANELRGNRKFVEHVAVLDEMLEDLDAWLPRPDDEP